MKYKDLKLVLCMPGDTFRRQNVQSLVQFIVWCINKDVKVYPIFSFAPYMHVVRNNLLGNGTLPLFQGNMEYTHILWIDTDIEYLPNDFTSLIERDKDIIGGGYMISPRTYSVSIDDKCMITRDKYEAYTEPFEIKWGGLGFTLVKKGVFETLPSPWFMSEELIGEDVAFYRAARRAGYKIWCDPRVNLTHYKVQGLNKGLRYKDVDAIIKLLSMEIGKEELLKKVEVI